MKTMKSRSVVFAIICALSNVELMAASIKLEKRNESKFEGFNKAHQKVDDKGLQKQPAPVITSPTLQHAIRFAANVSVAFFCLGQSSYHLGNLLTGSWFENQLKGTNAYSQSLRFAIGMVGTSLLLLGVSCLDHFGYSDLAGNADELVETENIVDGTPQAPVRQRISPADIN